jgi:hypothetical protein
VFGCSAASLSKTFLFEKEKPLGKVEKGRVMKYLLRGASLAANASTEGAMFGVKSTSHFNDLDKRNPYYATFVHNAYDQSENKRVGTRYLYITHLEVINNDYRLTASAVKDLGVETVIHNQMNNIIDLAMGIKSAMPDVPPEVVEGFGAMFAIPLGHKLIKRSLGDSQTGLGVIQAP